MRILLLALLLAGPARAWEFTADPICRLDHATAEVSVTLTYDPAGPEYTISLTRAEGQWPDAPVFAMRFEGGRTIAISTRRHALEDAGRTLTVRDRGFGNVLDGLEFNARATAALVGADGVAAATVLPLDGAAPEVAAFRACPAPPMT